MCSTNLGDAEFRRNYMIWEWIKLKVWFFFYFVIVQEQSIFQSVRKPIAPQLYSKPEMGVTMFGKIKKVGDVKKVVCNMQSDDIMCIV